ncbi:unnamed protein product, partial [Dovyalis caffra]
IWCGLWAEWVGLKGITGLGEEDWNICVGWACEGPRAGAFGGLGKGLWAEDSGLERGPKTGEGSEWDKAELMAWT